MSTFESVEQTPKKSNRNQLGNHLHYPADGVNHFLNNCGQLWLHPLLLTP